LIGWEQCGKKHGNMPEAAAIEKRKAKPFIFPHNTTISSYIITKIIFTRFDKKIIN
jgi:hypothetical protein